MISIITLIAFSLLAAALLIPVYRFLKREEEASKKWTHEVLEERLRERERLRRQEEADDEQSTQA